MDLVTLKADGLNVVFGSKTKRPKDVSGDKWEVPKLNTTAFHEDTGLAKEVYLGMRGDSLDPAEAEQGKGANIVKILSKIDFTELAKSKQGEKIIKEYKKWMTKMIAGVLEDEVSARAPTTMLFFVFVPDAYRNASSSPTPQAASLC